MTFNSYSPSLLTDRDPASYITLALPRDIRDKLLDKFTSKADDGLINATPPRTESIYYIQVDTVNYSRVFKWRVSHRDSKSHCSVKNEKKGIVKDEQFQPRTFRVAILFQSSRNMPL